VADKKRTPATTDASQEIVKICFERIIPDDLDPERSARRVLRNQMAESIDGKLNPATLAHIARMALINTKKWAVGSTVKCSFLDGSSSMRRKVELVAHQWEKYAKVKFKFVTSEPSEIRISFYADNGSWSAVGRDALNTGYFPLHQPTMNYGWLRDTTSDEEYSRVVLHEFGHALGCVHEHQSPKFSRVWNKKAVLKYFQGPPNYWSPQEIQQNVLNKYSAKGISATEYDPKSIMLYAFDGALFSDNSGPTNTNRKLSSDDIKMIKKMYSK
jgi:hypothetical protein